MVCECACTPHRGPATAPGCVWAGDVVMMRLGDIVPADVKLLGEQGDNDQPLQVCHSVMSKPQTLPSAVCAWLLQALAERCGPAVSVYRYATCSVRILAWLPACLASAAPNQHACSAPACMSPLVVPSTYCFQHAFQRCGSVGGFPVWRAFRVCERWGTRRWTRRR